MGTESKEQAGQSRMVQGAGWAAGIGITLVEMQFGMEYVLSTFVGHVSSIIGWLPMIGTLVRQVWG